MRLRVSLSTRHWQQANHWSSPLPFSPRYPAGGADALVDGLKGRRTTRMGSGKDTGTDLKLLSTSARRFRCAP
jgi:hypothetical protein